MGGSASRTTVGDTGGFVVEPCRYTGDEYSVPHTGCNHCGRRMGGQLFFACETCTERRIDCEVSCELCADCLRDHDILDHTVLMYKNRWCLGRVTSTAGQGRLRVVLSDDWAAIVGDHTLQTAFVYIPTGCIHDKIANLVVPESPSQSKVGDQGAGSVELCAGIADEVQNTSNSPRQLRRKSGDVGASLERIAEVLMDMKGVARDNLTDGASVMSPGSDARCSTQDGCIHSKTPDFVLPENSSQGDVGEQTPCSVELGSTIRDEQRNTSKSSTQFRTLDIDVGISVERFAEALMGMKSVARRSPTGGASTTSPEIDTRCSTQVHPPTDWSSDAVPGHIESRSDEETVRLADDGEIDQVHFPVGGTSEEIAGHTKVWRDETIHVNAGFSTDRLAERLTNVQSAGQSPHGDGEVGQWHSCFGTMSEELSPQMKSWKNAVMIPEDAGCSTDRPAEMVTCIKNVAQELDDDGEFNQVHCSHLSAENVGHLKIWRGEATNHAEALLPNDCITDSLLCIRRLAERLAGELARRLTCIESAAPESDDDNKIDSVRPRASRISKDFERHTRNRRDKELAHVDAGFSDHRLTEMRTCMKNVAQDLDNDGELDHVHCSTCFMPERLENLTESWVSDHPRSDIAKCARSVPRSMGQVPCGSQAVFEQTSVPGVESLTSRRDRSSHVICERTFSRSAKMVNVARSPGGCSHMDRTCSGRACSEGWADINASSSHSLLMNHSVGDAGPLGSKPWLRLFRGEFSTVTALLPKVIA